MPAVRQLDMMTEIGNRLRRTRLALPSAPSQYTIARMLQTSRTAWSNWEQGAKLPDPLVMLRLKIRHGVTLDWIYSGDPAGLPHDLAEKLLGAPSSTAA